MMKIKRSKKGFTLAELLIVIAIIAVLVAIAIPVFSNAMDSANEAVDNANIRAAYAQYVMTKMTAGGAVAPATLDEVKAALGAIGVTELKRFSTISVPADGTNWKGGTTATSVTAVSAITLTPP